jgi:nicotinamidase-related amidase
MPTEPKVLACLAIAQANPAWAILNAARQAGIPVIFVRVAFREGHPEVRARNKSFSAVGKPGTVVGSLGSLILANAAAQIHDSVAPVAQEPTVTKLRLSAFKGNDLEVILRSQGIDTLVLAGIATSGVVVSTLR